MGIVFQLDIVEPYYATEVATDANYQSPGRYGLPDGFGGTPLASFDIAEYGRGYQVGDTFSIDGGVYDSAASFTVTEIQVPFILVSAALADFGTGYAVNNVLTLVGGTSTTAAKITVDAVDGDGVIISYSITEQGSYTVIPTDNLVTATGGAGTGATFNPYWGGAVVTAELSNPGSYLDVPDNPVETTSSSGSGVTGIAYWSASPETRLLTLIEVLRACFADLSTGRESKVAEKIIRKMIAHLSAGNATKYANKAQEAGLRTLVRLNGAGLS